jgi:hypothetical protein
MLSASKARVASVKMALAEGVAVEEIDRYTTEQVETLLKKLPRTKFMAAQDMVNKLVLFKDAKRNLRKGPGPTDDDRQRQP